MESAAAALTLHAAVLCRLWLRQKTEKIRFDVVMNLCSFTTRNYAEAIKVSVSNNRKSDTNDVKTLNLKPAIDVLLSACIDRTAVSPITRSHRGHVLDSRIQMEISLAPQHLRASRNRLIARTGLENRCATKKTVLGNVLSQSIMVGQ